ncbi:MICOS complex subunit MIC10 isoform X2 [Dendrobates tinctorius]|uniref:MICOS complex subunit MIC10 isoform X2 n=1 Tax=Dendrobates tinctorius TaxID=92724 RepID=UPI003CCA287C
MSESELGRKWDRCLADAAVKFGQGDHLQGDCRGRFLETELPVPDWDWGLYFPLFSLKERRGPSCSPPGSAWEWRTQTARTTSSLRTFCMASSSKISDPVRSVGRLDPTLEPPDPAPVFAVLVCFIFSVSTIWGNKD